MALVDVLEKTNHSLRSTGDHIQTALVATKQALEQASEQSFKPAQALVFWTRWMVVAVAMQAALLLAQLLVPLLA